MSHYLIEDCSVGEMGGVSVFEEEEAGRRFSSLSNN
jgi:hypothetical protein